MSNTNELPVSIDGTRLDTLAYNIETMTGRHNLAQTRNADTPVPGRNGVIPSYYDDYEAGQVFLQMWVRSRDVNGNLPAGELPKQRLIKNLDRIYSLCRSRHKLLDLRDQVGPDGQDRWSMTVNPRLTESAATTSIVRENHIVNPSFETSGTSSTLRRNLAKNPSFETGVTQWTATGCTLATAAGGSVGSQHGRMTVTAGATVTEIYSNNIVPSIGLVFVASAKVACLQVEEGLQMNIRVRWYDAGSVLISEDSGIPSEAPPSFKFGVYYPNWVSVDVSSLCPAGASFGRVVIAVEQTSRATGEEYAVDAVICEQSQTPGPYFDGSFTEIGASWGSTIHSSDSVIGVLGVANWSVPSQGKLMWTTGDAAVSTHYGRWLAIAELTGSGNPILWQAGTLPTATAGSDWSGGIFVKADLEGPPRLKLRIAACDAAGTRIGYGRIGSQTGPIAETVFTPSSIWWRYRLEHVVMPASTARARLEVLADSALPEGTELFFDAADLQGVHLSPRYFDGSEAGYSWAGTAHASTSRLLKGAVDGWFPTRGTIVVSTSDLDLPNDPSSHTCGLFTHTTTGGVPYIVGTDALPDTIPGPWTAGAWVWGSALLPGGQVTIQSYNGGVFVSEEVGEVVDVQSGWTWVPGPDMALAAPADRLRMRIRFLNLDGSAPGTTGGNARVCGAVLSTGTSDGLTYYDENSPGAANFVSRVRRMGDKRQAMVKTVAGVVPEVSVNQAGHLTARLRLEFAIPTSFWQDAADAIWFSPSMSASSTRIFEIPVLRGATAPIEDAIIYVYGSAAAGAKLTDPVTGGWIRLNGSIPAGQAWKIDAGRGQSMRGAANLGSTSSAWVDVQRATDYVSPRSPMFMLHPEWDETRQIHVVRISVSGATGIKVTARRKYLG